MVCNYAVRPTIVRAHVGVGGIVQLGSLVILLGVFLLLPMFLRLGSATSLWGKVML